MAEVNLSGVAAGSMGWRKMSTQNRKSVLTIIGSTRALKYALR